MPNEVEIRITANDLTGPAFASAMAKLALLKKAADDLGGQSVITVDVAGMSSALTALKSKIQSMGIADLADVNVQPGVLTARLQLLKRLINQAGITDLLDFNVNDASVARQIGKLSDLTETIPVNFDVGQFPTLGLTRGMDINIGLNESDIANLTTARLGFKALGISAAEAAAAMKILDMSTMQADASLAIAWKDAIAFDKAIDNAHYDANIMNDRMNAMAAAIDETNKRFVTGIPLLDGWGIGWGRLTGKFQLFGGALTGMGIPAILGTASAMHILVDWAAEFLAVIVPAGIALAAFGIGAAPTIGDIYQRMLAVFNVSRALNTEIYPMSGLFLKMANAVQPSVYQLFGQALVLMNAKTGEFTKLAVGAGGALDQLGARATAALVNGGLGTFLKNGPQDILGLGTVLGNLFGTLGNFLKTMPGYAQVILRAWEDVTGALEAVSASPITQWIVRLGLIAHGAVLYIGLLATGVVFLGNALVGLAAKFGLAADGALFFNGAMFGAGLGQIAKGAFLAAAGMLGLSTSEDIATGSTLALAGANLALDAVSPFAWVAGAVIGLGALVWWIGKAGSATQNYDNAVKAALSQSPLNYLSLQITQEQAATTEKLANAQIAAAAATKSYSSYLKDGKGATIGWYMAQQKANDVVAGYQGELGTLKTYQENYNTLLKAAGGNLGDLTAAGITSNDIIGASKNQMAQYVIQVQAAADAVKALSLGVGRNAAALNAESNLYLTENIPALQQLTQAEDNVLNVILAGPQAFVSFQQALAQINTDATTAGSSLLGLSGSGLTVSADFYNSLVPAAQKVIDALQQQGISTDNLTKAVATEVQGMLPFTQGNTEAKSILVDLINNALGPGTVSLQTLNTWVGKNATTLNGFNNIVAASAIQAGTLAGVLEKQLNAQFEQALLQTSGADKALNTYTQDLVNGTDKTKKGQADRQQLITDLENAGLSAQDATTFVNNLQKQIDILHGKNVAVGVQASGSGAIIGKAFIAGKLGQTSELSFSAAGGLMRGGIPGKDSILSMLMPGELVVPTGLVRAGVVDHLRGKLPGFESGGLVGSDAQTWMGNLAGPWGNNASVGFGKSVLAAFVTALKGAVAPPSGGPGGGSPSANAALARRLFYPWSFGPEWTAWNAVAMRESGWNNFAMNSSSGAYGIPQALPYTKMPKAAWPGFAGGSSDPTAQIGWMVGYIESRYGDPINAWLHEMQYGWYDQGGWLKPGWTMAYNGTGSPEAVGGGGVIQIVVSYDASAQKGLTPEEIKRIRYTVVHKGGGDVQQTFGRNGA